MSHIFPSRRSVVQSFGGMVATSQPLAAQAGLQLLLNGGNAIDAAIATAAALNVVEPMSTGIGGDMFALVYWARDRRVYAINGSGRSPARATIEEFARRGLQQMPTHGILPVTVPGAAAGWADLLDRFGQRGLDAALQPAIRYAEQGYPVSELIASGWRATESLLRQDSEATRAFLPQGRAPRSGERFRVPDLAQSLRQLAENGPEAFYRGAIAQAIVRTSEAYDGLFALEDLANHTSTWVEPLQAGYRGHTVYECPPNGQGIAALLALQILAGYDIGGMAWDDAEALHAKMEAVKLGMTDAARYVADPEHVRVPTKTLLSEAYASQRRALIQPERAILDPQPGAIPAGSDTIYLCTADAEGNAVSFINSLYMAFGSGIVAQGTGIALQNRGNLFRLDPDHPNCLAPGKRPYHTIIPCMVTRDDKLAICYGVMGGFMQPQGHVQVLSNLLDHEMDPQRALDAPRFRYDSRAAFALEEGFPEETYQALETKGHQLQRQPVNMGFGGGQVIQVDPDSGAYRGGSDPRKDGGVVAV